MLPKVYFTLVLATGLGSLAATAGAAEPYDITNCFSSTVTTVAATEELTVLNSDAATLRIKPSITQRISVRAP
jgi:hypothetical protein